MHDSNIHNVIGWLADFAGRSYTSEWHFGLTPREINLYIGESWTTVKIVAGITVRGSRPRISI